MTSYMDVYIVQAKYIYIYMYICTAYIPLIPSITRNILLTLINNDSETVILGSEMIGNLNIKAKLFDFEELVLIGWLANTVREPVNKDSYFKVQHFCVHFKVVYHFRPEYSY